MRRIATLLMVVVFATLLFAEGYRDVSAKAALDMVMDGEVIVVDVSPMWEKGHLPMAISAPLGDGSLENMMKEWDKNAKYLVYCHGDGPSIAASKKLVEAGFKNVMRLEGNYGAWEKAGYPIEVDGYVDISASYLNKMLKSEDAPSVIDVSPMYDKGHIPGAMSLPLGDGTFEKKLPELVASEEYVIYCHGARPAIQAAKLMVANDFEHVYRLKGNFAAWKDAGYEIEK